MAYNPDDPAVRKLAREVADELTGNILPFWQSRVHTPLAPGRFLGRVTGRGEADYGAPLGAILISRVLWAFAAAYRVVGQESYLEVADDAKRLIIDHFMDPEYGGVYWAVDGRNPSARIDDKKQIYACGFAIYGLSEMYRACGDEEALDCAKRLFGSIERHSHDCRLGGYFEAFARDWRPIGDMRLSDKDENDAKTMNTHLHILEPYTNLYRVWKDAELEGRIRELVDIFCGRILDPATGHLRLFFDEKWNCHRDIISYGHDIEASWLLHEAALALGDAPTLARVEPVVKRIAAASAEGLTPEGAMVYENLVDRGHLDTDRHWWVQAENVVGNFNLYQHFGDLTALEAALKCWEYVKGNLVDRSQGEWHWSVRADGSVNLDDDKAGFWKCPYHNGRMCLEIMERAATGDGRARD